MKDKRLLYFAIVIATSLIYEVAWVRMFTLNFGLTVYVSSVVIAAFMGGIAIGAYVVTFLKQDAATLFKHMQWILGVYSLLLLLLYQHIFSLVLVFLLILIPTTLVGASYSLINKLLVKKHKDIGIIYAVDTIAAGCGALIGGFIMLPLFGISLTVILTAALNILIALLWRNTQ